MAGFQRSVAVVVACALLAAVVDAASVPVYESMGVDWQYKDQDGTTLSHYDFRYYRACTRLCAAACLPPPPSVDASRHVGGQCALYRCGLAHVCAWHVLRPGDLNVVRFQEYFADYTSACPCSQPAVFAPRRGRRHACRHVRTMHVAAHKCNTTLRLRLVACGWVHVSHPQRSGSATTPTSRAPPRSCTIRCAVGCASPCSSG